MEVELILAIVVAVCTFVYTIINALMFWENRLTRLQKNKPFIIGYLKSSENHNTLNLYIENIGEGYARDVKFHFKKDHKQFGLKMLTDMYGCLKNGIESFPPNYKIEIIVDSYGEEFNLNDEGSYLLFDIKYQDIRKKKYVNTYRLPFNQIHGIYSNPPGTYIGQISYNLNEINKTLKVNCNG